MMQARVSVRMYRPTPIGEVLKTLSPVQIIYRLVFVPLLGMEFSHCALRIGETIYDYDYRGLTAFPFQYDYIYRPDFVDIPCPWTKKGIVCAQINNPWAFWNAQQPGLIGYLSGFNCVSFASQCLSLTGVSNMTDLEHVIGQLNAQWGEATGWSE